MIKTRNSTSLKLVMITLFPKIISLKLTVNLLTLFHCSQPQVSLASIPTQKFNTSLMQPKDSGIISWQCRLQMVQVEEVSTGKKSLPRSLMTSKLRLYQKYSMNTTSESHLIFPHQPRLCFYRSLKGTINSSSKWQPLS